MSERDIINHTAENSARSQMVHQFDNSAILTAKRIGRVLLSEKAVVVN